MSAPEAPNFQAYLDRVEGRSVIRMARRDWESVMGRTGEPVALDVTQTPLGGVAPKVVAAVAEPHAPGISRIEIYRYDAKDAPTPINVDRFLVLEDPTSARISSETINVATSTSRFATHRSKTLKSVYAASNRCTKRASDALAGAAVW